MSAPTGEREGARETWDKNGPPMMCQCGALKLDPATWSYTGLDNIQHARKACGPVPPIAAPAQPGEGEPSADEWANAIVTHLKHEGCLYCVRALRPVKPSDWLCAADCCTPLRALLERRGGKGLSGKGGRG